MGREEWKHCQKYLSMLGWDVGRLLPGATVYQPHTQNRMLVEKPFYMYYEMFVFTFFRPCKMYLLIGYCIYTFFNERCIMYRLCSYTTSGCDFSHNLQMKQGWVWTVVGWATAPLWRMGVWVTNLYSGAVAGSFWLEVFFPLSQAHVLE